MFILAGNIFDPRAPLQQHCMDVRRRRVNRRSRGPLAWQLELEGVTLTGGDTGVPGSRSLVNTFPFFTASDRTMAGQLLPSGLHAGSLGERRADQRAELSVVRRQRPQHIEHICEQDRYASHVSGSVWWEPLGDYGGNRQGTEHVRRLFCFQEDLHSAWDRASPERGRTGSRISINRIPRTPRCTTPTANPTFSTGAFAPGVTVDEATYKMWAIDGGVKVERSCDQRPVLFPLGR